MQVQSLLVLEDDHDTRVTLRQVLEAEGYQVLTATNGIDGLALLRTHRFKRPSLILLDQNMPLMNGEQFIACKNADPELAPLPVAVISAVRDRTASLGVVDFIPKPIDIARLFTTIRKHSLPAA